MIGYDFGMHRAGVLLLWRVIVLLSGRLLDLVLTMRVLCYECVARHQRKCARDYGCNVFSHFVWL
jgi:hypothetical protein